MKRNRKYNKNLVQANLMNGLRHIVLLLGIGLLFAQDPPEEFQFNQSTLQAFYYFNSVTINGVTIESNDWVGAFNGDICVGAHQWDTSLCGNGLCDLPVMGQDAWPESSGYMQSGDIPTYKIYDASENLYYDAVPSENIPWTNNGFLNINELIAMESVFACTDESACNYDPSATVNDGSCEFNLDCEGECGGTTEDDACGVCGGDNSSCSGCTDSFAINYEDAAIVNDGSCEYPVYGCLDETALNYNPDATNSNGNCNYPPEVGIWFGNIDADAGTMEIYRSSNSNLDNISFSITGATITDATEGSVTDNSFIISGFLNAGTDLLTVLSFTNGESEFCISNGVAAAPGYDSVNLTLGGCSVLVGLEGGVVESESGGVDIPAGALTELENIAVGDVTEVLPEEIDNATGFEVEELVAFTPFGLVFEVPVEISVFSTSQSREDEYLCYLEDASDTAWEVVAGADCSDGTCTAYVMEFGIFAACVLVEDCNGDLGGFAYLDNCGECVGGETGNEANYTMDECGLCDGPGTIEWYEDTDGDNLGFGEGVSLCADEVEEGYVPNDDDSEPNCESNDTDDCGVCGGGNLDNLGCGCFESGPSGCDYTCGSTLGLDNCGVCNGDNTDCWFINITTSIGYLAIEDSLSRIGMHEAAEDDFNAVADGTYESYEDEVDLTQNSSPNNYIDFYFPHPEWAEDIQEFIGSSAGTDLRKDIRHLEPFTVADLDFNSSITVGGKIYYAQQIWDLMIDTDQTISSLPFGEDNVKLEFNFVNQIPNSEDFTKIFFYKDNNGNAEIEEISPFGWLLTLPPAISIISTCKLTFSM